MQVDAGTALDLPPLECPLWIEDPRCDMIQVLTMASSGSVRPHKTLGTVNSAEAMTGSAACFSNNAVTLPYYSSEVQTI